MRGGDNKMGLIKCTMVFLNVKIFVHEKLKKEIDHDERNESSYIPESGWSGRRCICNDGAGLM